MRRTARALPAPLRLVGLLAALTFGGPSAGHAGPPVDPQAVVDAVHALEGKALLPVLRAAVKSDHRRQAWWLAGRLLAVLPKSDEATTALKAFTPEQLQEGEAPSRAFVAQRDAALKKVGAAYAKAAREVTASGAPAEAAWPLVERALALGNDDADVVQAAATAGETFCGGFGMVKTLDVEEWLGTTPTPVLWMSDWDDASLRVRVVWPDAKVARIGVLRVAVGGTPNEALPRLALLSAVDATFVRMFGSLAKEEKDPERAAETWSTLVLATEPAVFEKVAKAVTTSGGRRARPAESPEGASSWLEPWRRIAVVLREHRDNAWVPPDALACGMAAYLLARHHLVAPVGGSPFDSGTWALLTGLRGLFEGAARSSQGRAAVVSLGSCASWRVAVARAARDRGTFHAWPSLLAMSGTEVAELPLVDFGVSYRGASQEARRVTIASAQATALVATLVLRDTEKADGKPDSKPDTKPDRGARRFAGLLSDVAKRGAAPDLDKAVGARPGTVARWVDEVLDGCN